LGQPLDLPLPVTVVAISPGHDYALAVSAADLTPLLLRLSSMPVTAGPLGENLPRPDLAVISPGGSSAALYNRAAGTVDVLRGLPDAPSSAGRVAVGDGTNLTAMAVSDDGTLVLAATDSGAVVAYAAGESRFVTALPQVNAVAFLRSSHDAVVCDAQQKAVYLLRDAGGGGEIRQLASEKDGLGHPVAVVVSKDGGKVWVADSSGQFVLEMDVTGGGNRTIACPCTPSRLRPLLGENVFQLTDAGAGPIWILDAGSPDPRVLFVPPVVADPAASGGVR
jgi:hypothetical protein